MKYLLFLCVIMLFPVLIAEKSIIHGIEPYHYISHSQMDRAFEPQLFELVAGIPYINSLLSLLAIVLFYLLLKRFSVSNKTAILSCLVLSISPIMLSSSFFLTPSALAMVLALSAMLLAENKRYFMSSILLIMLSVTDFLTLIPLLVIFLIRKQRGLFMVSTILVIAAGIFNIIIGKSFGFFGSNPISDIGGDYGIGIVFLTISLIGISEFWMLNQKNWKKCILAVLLIMASVSSRSIMMTGTIMLSYFAGLALTKLLERRWDNPNLKTLTITAIASGLILSFLTFGIRMAETPPNADLLQSLNKSSGHVLTHEKYGAWLEYLGKEPYIDDWSIFYRNENKRVSEVEKFLQGRSLTNATRFLKDNSIDEIIITAEMKKGLVWQVPDQGLLFLLENKDVFEKTYEDENLEIWRLKP